MGQGKKDWQAKQVQQMEKEKGSGDLPPPPPLFSPPPPFSSCFLFAPSLSGEPVHRLLLYLCPDTPVAASFYRAILSRGLFCLSLNTLGENKDSSSLRSWQLADVITWCLEDGGIPGDDFSLNLQEQAISVEIHSSHSYLCLQGHCCGEVGL